MPPTQSVRSSRGSLGGEKKTICRIEFVALPIEQSLLRAHLFLMLAVQNCDNSREVRTLSWIMIPAAEKRRVRNNTNIVREYTPLHQWHHPPAILRQIGNFYGKSQLIRFCCILHRNSRSDGIFGHLKFDSAEIIRYNKTSAFTQGYN